MTRSRAARRGLTLVELLVVMSILTLLATLVIAVTPYIGERSRTASGAELLQGWLLIAKQRAFRDQRPCGLRIPALVGNPYFVNTLQYVEEPDPLVVNGLTNYRYIGGYGYVTTGLPFDGTLPPDGQAIQPGDVLQLASADPAAPIYYVLNVTSVNVSGTNYIDLQLDRDARPSNPPAAPNFSGAATVYRNARPIIGEPALLMPKDIVIDTGLRTTDPNPSGAPQPFRLYPAFNGGGNQPADIMFSPSGSVIGPSIARGVGRIVLWVRDGSLNDPGYGYLPDGDNRLITIYTKTGLISKHEVDQTTNASGQLTQPFSFTQSAQSSGL